jgi:diguanylate cyclase (GGDEF)-like protein
MILDRQQNIVDVNAFGAGLLEYQPAELVGSGLAEYVLNAPIHPSGINEIITLEADASLDHSHSRIFGITKSGRHVQLCVKTQHLRNGRTYAVFHDPTEYASGDSLTNALTRDQFFVKLQKMTVTYSLLFIDLNKFKEVNDTLGHITGDMVLKTVSARIRNILRETDLFCRYGGDEFVIVIPGTAAGANAVRKKIEKLVSDDIYTRDGSVTVSCSIGVVRSTEADNVDDLIHIADQRMYTEKL